MKCILTEKALAFYLWNQLDNQVSVLLQQFMEKELSAERFADEMGRLRISVRQPGQYLPVMLHQMDKQMASVWMSREHLREKMQQFIRNTQSNWGGPPIIGRTGTREFMLIIQEHENEEKRELGRELLGQHIHQLMLDQNNALAFYMGEPVELSRLPEERNKLLQMLRDNVSNQPGVFVKSNKASAGGAGYPDMKHWARLLAHGGIAQVRRQAHTFFQGTFLAQEGGFQILSRFHQDFVNLVLDVAKDREGLWRSLVSGHFDVYLAAYTNIEQMHKLVDCTLDILLKENQAGKFPASPVERAVEYINLNLSGDLSRKSIAAHVHVSPEHLSRIFKEEMGMGVREFVINRRMELAQVMLVETDNSVADIASQLGYANFSHFSKTYREYCGLTPQDYRASHKLKKAG